MFFFAFKLNRKRLWVLLVLLLGLVPGFFPKQEEPASTIEAVLPLNELVIGIDPGHGGYDPGASQGEFLEKDIVLQVGLYLRSYLQQGGARVVMTRVDDSDLLACPAGPKKRTDLSNRLYLLEKAQVDLVISIHANYISSPRWRGAQAFYRQGCERSQSLSRVIQEELIRVLQNTTRQAAAGNYFILNETSDPAALVEIGFLSNPDEARLLNSPDYQKKIAWSIYLGIVRHLNEGPVNL